MSVYARGESQSLLFSLSLIPSTADQPHRGLGNQLALDQWDPQDLEPSEGGLWIRTYWALNLNLEPDKQAMSLNLERILPPDQMQLRVPLLLVLLLRLGQLQLPLPLLLLLMFALMQALSEIEICISACDGKTPYNLRSSFPSVERAKLTPSPLFTSIILIESSNP